MYEKALAAEAARALEKNQVGLILIYIYIDLYT